MLARLAKRAPDPESTATRTHTPIVPDEVRWAGARLAFFAYLGFSLFSVVGGFLTAPLMSWYIFGTWKFWRYLKYGPALFLHGWKNDDDEDDDIDGAYTAEQALIEQNYDPFGVVYTWDSDKGGGVDDGWYEAQEIARRNGPKLANFVVDWLYNDGRPIRMVSHSLGAQVVCSAMDATSKLPPIS